MNYVASNWVELDEYGNCPEDFETVGRINEARKEFYMKLRDKELGRWRDPKSPSFVVYAFKNENTNRIRIVDENTGQTEVYLRGKTDYSSFGLTASRYFSAHPEPKPWLDAKPGDVWLVNNLGKEYEAPVVFDKETETNYFLLEDGFNPAYKASVESRSIRNAFLISGNGGKK